MAKTLVTQPLKHRCTHNKSSKIQIKKAQEVSILNLIVSKLTFLEIQL